MGWGHRMSPHSTLSHPGPILLRGGAALRWQQDCATGVHQGPRVAEMKKRPSVAWGSSQTQAQHCLGCKIPITTPALFAQPIARTAVYISSTPGVVPPRRQGQTQRIIYI